MKTKTGFKNTGSTQTGNVTTDSGQRRDYNKTGDTKTSNLNTADKIGRGKEDEWRPPENNSGLWPMFEDICPISAYTNPEVLGYLINGPGKGISYASYIFLFEALIYLANMDACGSIESSYEYFDPVANVTVTVTTTDDFDTNMFASTPCDHEPYECTERIYGFRPASWIANIGTIGSIVTACFLPIAGAMIDFSASRKRIGFTAIMMVNVVGAIQVFIGQGNWLPMLLIQVSWGARSTTRRNPPQPAATRRNPPQPAASRSNPPIAPRSYSAPGFLWNVLLQCSPDRHLRIHAGAHDGPQ